MTTLLKNLAAPVLDHKTPMEAASRVTPGISNLLQFYFFQSIFHLDTDKSLFLASKELFGHWVSIADNVGDALTYLIFTPNNQAHSTLCPAYCPGHKNL